MKPYLEKHSTAAGSFEVTDATAHWWILKDEDALSQNSGFIASSGHMAALYQDELYEMSTSRAGVARLQLFGVIFGHQRVVIYVEPRSGNGRRLVSNTARTELIMGGEPLPWDVWAAEFRENMPVEIRQLIDEVAAGSHSSDFRQAIRDRLKQIKELFKLSRFRTSTTGKVMVADDDVTPGGTPEPTTQKRGPGTATGGGRGGRAGNVYSLFLTARGNPAEEISIRQLPAVAWITVEKGTRIPPDLDDRAARYIVQDNLIQANGDFRVFTDMVDRWCRQYNQVPGARATIELVVREWFEQQLVETIIGMQALRDERHWSLKDLSHAWSEEALTAAVMPRWHVDVNIKRHLGAKLGSLKDKTA